MLGSPFLWIAFTKVIPCELSLKNSAIIQWFRRRKTVLILGNMISYRRWNEVERFFWRIKRFRRAFTRYDKLDAVFAGFLLFAMIIDSRSLNKQLSEICEVISSLEEQLNGLIENPNLSKIVLQKHADAVREMDRMATENEAYQKTQDLKNAKKEDEGSLAKVKGEQFPG